MSKAEQIKKMVELIEESVFPIDSRGRFLIAEILYNANFRDITQLRDWLKSERDEKQGFLDEEHKSKYPRKDFKMGLTGIISTCQEVLNKLESL